MSSIGECLRIGDRCTVTIPEENREWGYNPCPDDTIVTIISFNEIHYTRVQNFGREPGIYPNYSWCTVCDDNGKEWDESSYRLDPIDQDAYKQREKEWREAGGPWKERDDKLRDLPETPFYEGDRVDYRDQLGRHAGEYVVQRIDYARMNDTIMNGSPWPIYSLGTSLTSGSYFSAPESALTLVSRGNFWKVEHNEHLVFADLPEEANFAIMRGETEHLRNPIYGNFKWGKDEALMAICSGFADGFAAGCVPFSNTVHHQVLKFKDRNLGERVRQFTILEFSSHMTEERDLEWA